MYFLVQRYENREKDTNELTVCTVVEWSLDGVMRENVMQTSMTRGKMATTMVG